MTTQPLNQLLRYDLETGLLFWLPRPESMFDGGRYPAARRCSSWNSRCAGQEAFTTVGSHGYREGTIFARHYLAHRVIWALQTGGFPSEEIDHINGDRLDNRWENLRAVSHAINMRNVAGKSVNASGHTGVSWDRAREKWKARIMVAGRDHTLGRFDDIEAAIAARQAALVLHGFTERHGRLVNDPV